MAHHHHVSTFSFVTALYFLSIFPLAIEGEDVHSSWTLGESGPIQTAALSPDEIELDEICKCISSDGFQPCATLVDYGPVIHNGSCDSDISTPVRRAISLTDGFGFGDPPAFVENKECRHTKSIILASSGNERQLTLTTAASVLICPGSVDASLEQLNVIGVKKIIIAPSAFKQRDTRIFLRFVDVQEKITIPEKAFSVKVVYEASSVSKTSPAELLEVDSIDTSPPPEVKLEINKVAEVEFKSFSIVAPIVNLKLSEIKNVVFGTKAIIPYEYHESSSFEVSNCQSVILATETMNTGKFEVKNIASLLMKERAIKVTESGAKIEHVSNMTLLDEALSIQSQADIILDNINLTYAGSKSISSTGPGNIRRATLTNVTGKGLESVAMCIRAETAIFDEAEFSGKSGVGGCLQAQAYHGGNIIGAVFCEKTEITGYICDDLRCERCAHETKDTVTGSTFLPPSTTHLLTTLAETEDPPVMLDAATTSLTESSTRASPISELTIDLSSTLENVIAPVTRPSVKELSNDKSYGSESSFLKGLEETPIYVVIIFFCAAIILVLFMAYMIYKCCTQNKHDKYNLPQENRLSTFRNPRTIMTPENLTRQNNVQKVDNTYVPEEYRQDFYRGQPSATYVTHSETLNLKDSSGFTEDQTAHSGDTTNECEASPVEEYQPVNLDTHSLPKYEEVPLDDYLPSQDNLPNLSHLPPPEEYVQLKGDQMSNLSSLTPDQDHTREEPNLPTVSEPPISDGQAHIHSEILQHNKFSSMELPVYAPPPVPSLERAESDGDVMVI